jgi:hypothetical protein
MLIVHVTKRCDRCGKVPRSRNEKENFDRRYPGYCSFSCQEWHRLEKAQAYLREKGHSC